jgi:8-hydroxy-5-deazaflavin:NADPH oxidoreductase
MNATTFRIGPRITRRRTSVLAGLLSGTARHLQVNPLGRPVNIGQVTPLARELGSLASAADVADAIERADAVIFAVWLDVLEDLVRQNAPRLAGKVVIDPSNPIGPDGKGGFMRTLPDGVSAGSVIAGLLPPGAHFVKALGTVSAEHLADAANRSPERAVLLYATDDGVAAATAERLISAAGFAPVQAGGLDQAIRIEMFGDLHDFGGLNGKLLTVAEARALLAGTQV